MGKASRRKRARRPTADAVKETLRAGPEALDALAGWIHVWEAEFALDVARLDIELLIAGAYEHWAVHIGQALNRSSCATPVAVRGLVSRGLDAVDRAIASKEGDKALALIRECHDAVSTGSIEPTVQEIQDLGERALVIHEMRKRHALAAETICGIPEDFIGEVGQIATDSFDYDEYTGHRLDFMLRRTGTDPVGTH